MSYVRSLSIIWITIIPFLCLTGCESAKHFRYHDPHLQMSKKEFDQALSSKQKGEVFSSPGFAPRPKKVSPPLPKFLNRAVSLSVTEQIPLKSVFMQIARQAQLNLVLDPKIEGGLCYQAHQQPFHEVLRKICEMKKLRFRIDGKTVQVELDTPYLKTYNIQFITATRKSLNRVSIATDVFTSIEDGSKSFDNGSSTLLTEDTTSDFWGELENNLKNILDVSQDKKQDRSSTYTIHKQGGLISIFGTAQQHQHINQYFQKLIETTQKQVLIEAKIVEVTLNEEFKSGINWQKMKSNLLAKGIFGDVIQEHKNTLSISYQQGSLSALIKLMHEYGTTNTLANPRMMIMNNEPGIIRVGKNAVFFKIEHNREILEHYKGTFEGISSQMKTIPVGLVMVVHPSIDHESGRITLALRPTISRIVSEKEDPAVAILSQNTRTSKVPEVQVREMSVVLNVKSGAVAIIGGLMQQKSNNETNGVPGLEDIPILGNLFKGKSNVRQVSELVIFLRATIQEHPIIYNADRQIYNTFTQDSRPLQL